MRVCVCAFRHIENVRSFLSTPILTNYINSQINYLMCALSECRIGWVVGGGGVMWQVVLNKVGMSDVQNKARSGNLCRCALEQYETCWVRPCLKSVSQRPCALIALLFHAGLATFCEKGIPLMTFHTTCYSHSPLPPPPLLLNINVLPAFASVNKIKSSEITLRVSGRLY